MNTIIIYKILFYNKNYFLNEAPSGKTYYYITKSSRFRQMQPKRTNSNTNIYYLNYTVQRMY